MTGIGDARRTLGVEAYIVERRSSLPGGVVAPSQAVFEEIAEEFLGARASGPGDVRPPDARRRQRPLQALGGVVIELEVFLRRALPISDIRFVPDLPPPALHFRAAVLLDRVSHPLIDERPPSVVVRRRVRPACKNLAVLIAGRPLVSVRLRF